MANKGKNTNQTTRRGCRLVPVRLSRQRSTKSFDMFLSVINLEPLPATGIAKGKSMRRYANIGNRTKPEGQVRPVNQGQGASPGGRGRPLSRVYREGRGLRRPEAAAEMTAETF
jgi:hypothetical protein